MRSPHRKWTVGSFHVRAVRPSHERVVRYRGCISCVICWIFHLDGVDTCATTSHGHYGSFGESPEFSGREAASCQDGAVVDDAVNAVVSHAVYRVTFHSLVILVTLQDDT